MNGDCLALAVLDPSNNSVQEFEWREREYLPLAFDNERLDTYIQA